MNEFARTVISFLFPLVLMTVFPLTVTDTFTVDDDAALMGDGKIKCQTKEAMSG